MGADIHLFVEYDHGSTKRAGLPDTIPGGPFTNTEKLSLFSDSDISIPPYYRLFACLAGVRNRSDMPPLFEPRGFPAIHGTDLMVQFTNYVFDEDQDPYRFEDAVERTVADEWVRTGKSRYFDLSHKRNARVSSPDWHAPSWLYRDEIVAAMDHFGLLEDREVPLEFRVTLDLLASLENHFGTRRARAVFWFDN